MFRRYFIPIFKVFGFVVVYMVALGIIMALIFFSSGQLASQELSELLIGALSLLVALLITFLYLRIDKRSFADIGSWIHTGWYKKLLRGSIEGIAAIMLVFILLLISGLAAVRGFNETDPGMIIIKLTAGILLYLPSVAYSEELLTRGYIYHYLKTRFTIAGAVLTTSLIFALMHIFNPNVTPLALFNIFLAGIVLNLLVLRDGKLWSAVGFHFGWNYTMGVVFASPVSGGKGEGIIRLSLKGYELLTGGAFGIEGGVICTAVLAMLVFYLFYRIEQKDSFLRGLKLWKSSSFIGFMVIGALVYITYDVLLWMPRPLPPDSIEINSIAPFPDAHDYTMRLELDTQYKKVTGQQTVSFINNESTPLEEAYFHIYPNAFKNLGGSIVIKGIKVNGNDSQYRIEGQDSTLLYVPFPGTLEPGERNQIFMEYEISIPKEGGAGFGDRFGYGDNTYNLGNFFPIAAVYENGSWDKHPYDEKGDAFYSETSNFDVEITAPAEQVIAASGYVDNLKVLENKRTHVIKAYSVRDFAFVSSDMFRVEEAMVNGTIVRSYAASSRKAEKVLEYGTEAIRIFNKSYGKYPYPVCSIVQSDIGGGMEYPNLVMIESNEYGNVTFGNFFASYYFGKPKGSLEFVVVHELAHQWWYGIVGNDEYREAWIDEPLTQYSTLEYYRQVYGQEEFDRIYKRYIKLGVNMFLLSGAGEDKPLNRPLNQFPHDDYYILIYNKGTMMFKDLNDQLGDEKFDKLLRTLFERYKFKAVSGKDFIELTSEIAGKDMGEFYRKWLETNYIGDEL
ncbi:MAG TPA: M1 family aminopeptidase [Clostridia bacterium]|nr:M1 family aminopeptidase [Clostridia bacterium]